MSWCVSICILCICIYLFFCTIRDIYSVDGYFIHNKAIMYLIIHIYCIRTLTLTNNRFFAFYFFYLFIYLLELFFETKTSNVHWYVYIDVDIRSQVNLYSFLISILKFTYSKMVILSVDYTFSTLFHFLYIEWILFVCAIWIHCE